MSGLPRPMRWLPPIVAREKEAMLSLTVRAILVKERLSSRSSGGPSSGSWLVLPVAASSPTAVFRR